MIRLPVVREPARTATPWIGPHGKRMERLELHLTYTCPERCSFCSEEHRMQAFRRYPVTWGRVATVLRTHASRGVKSVHFTGGEPTIHPEFVDALVLAKKLGMRTSIGTIGTRLCDEEFARRALPHLDEALFSLHGPTAEAHDGLTNRPGSFERVVRAMTLAKKLAPELGLYVNSVITRLNIEQLGDTVALAESLGATLIVVSNMTPEGGGIDRYEELAVPLEQLARVLPAVPRRVERAILRFFGVPMCILGEHAMLSNDLHWDPRVTVEWQSQPGKVAFDGIYTWTPARQRVHVESCGSCARKGVCVGVFDRYAELFPVSALRPLAREGEGAVP